MIQSLAISSVAPTKPEAVPAKQLMQPLPTVYRAWDTNDDPIGNIYGVL